MHVYMYAYVRIHIHIKLNREISCNSAMQLALKSARVKVKEYIPELALRTHCTILFRHIESLPESHIIVDFEGL